MTYIADSPICPHCGHSNRRDSSTTLCFKCGEDVLAPNAYEREEIQRIDMGCELIFWRIERGELDGWPKARSFTC